MLANGLLTFISFFHFRYSNGHKKSLYEMIPYRLSSECHSSFGTCLFIVSSWYIQPDIINVQGSCSLGRGAACAPDANGDLIHIRQIDPLIGKGL